MSELRDSTNAEIAKRVAFKDKQAQRLARLDAEAKAAKTAKPAPKKTTPTAGSPSDIPQKPEGMSDSLWAHLHRGPTDA